MAQAAQTTVAFNGALTITNGKLFNENDTTAILMPCAPSIGGWMNEQSTPAGVYIRNELHKLNK